MSSASTFACGDPFPALLYSVDAIPYDMTITDPNNNLAKTIQKLKGENKYWTIFEQHKNKSNKSNKHQSNNHTDEESSDSDPGANPRIGMRRRRGSSLAKIQGGAAAEDAFYKLVDGEKPHADLHVIRAPTEPEWDRRPKDQ